MPKVPAITQPQCDLTPSIRSDPHTEGGPFNLRGVVLSDQ